MTLEGIIAIVILSLIVIFGLADWYWAALEDRRWSDRQALRERAWREVEYRHGIYIDGNSSVHFE